MANNVVASSRDLGMMYELNGPEYDGKDRDDSDAIKRWGQVMLSKWSFQWTGIPEDDWKLARMRLIEVASASETDLDTKEDRMYY